jgi:hypothetical protein
MNKSFLIIFIPALIVAAMYLSLGIYPPRRIEIGIAIVAAALGAWRIRWMMMKRGRSDTPKAVSSSASVKP